MCGMGKRRAVCLLVCTLLMLFGAACRADGLVVCNRESDLRDPERLNMRAEPSAGGAIIGLYYTGAQVEDLGPVNDAFEHVRIGGVTGYMVRQYLMSEEEARRLYGEESGFGGCRAAEIDLTGLWRQEQPLLPEMDERAEPLASLRTGDAVRLIGIVGDWAYIGAGDLIGYVPLDALTDVGAAKVCVVAGAGEEGAITLYDLPNNSAAAILQVQSGASCFSLFGRGEGNWRRVRVGGVTGWIKYTQADALQSVGGAVRRGAVPYYPPVYLARAGASLSEMPGGAPSVPLAEGTPVEVLGRTQAFAYARTLEGGAGASGEGRFGYVALSLLGEEMRGPSGDVAQADDGDLPVLLYAAPDEDAERVGALCAGAQVYVADYTQTDYALLALGERRAYAQKAKLRILGGAGEQAGERIPQRARARETLPLLSAPSQGAQALRVVAAGARVYMLGVMGEWAYVCTGDAAQLAGAEGDRMGFVPLASLDAPASTTHLTAFVTRDKVNLRDRSGLSGEIISRARLGECLRVAEYGVDWCCVVTPDGKRGYIMTEFLEFG